MFERVEGKLMDFVELFFDGHAKTLALAQRSAGSSGSLDMALDNLVGVQIRGIDTQDMKRQPSLGRSNAFIDTFLGGA